MQRVGLIQAMPGDFLRIMGKVLVIGGIGMAAAVVFGGAGLAVGSILGGIASVVAGAACLVVASSVHRRAIEACYSDEQANRHAVSPPIMRSIGEGRGVGTPAVNAGQSAPSRAASEGDEDAAVGRFVEQLEAERLNAALSQRVH